MNSPGHLPLFHQSQSRSPRTAPVLGRRDMISYHASTQFNPRQRTAASSRFWRQATWPLRLHVAARPPKHCGGWTAGDGRAPGPRAPRFGGFALVRANSCQSLPRMNRPKASLIVVNPVACLVTFEPSHARRSGQGRPLARFGCRSVRFGFPEIHPSDLLSVIIGRPSFGCRLPIIGSVVKKLVEIRVIRVKAFWPFPTKVGVGRSK
jgi:hypothetical protein